MRNQVWYRLEPRASIDELGLLAEFLDPADPDSAVVQLDKHYRHGGGWHPMPGFERIDEKYRLQYPGDPEMTPLYVTQLRQEFICVYRHGFVAVFQPDGTFEVARMD